MTPIKEWLASRPECVQALAREFPFGSCFDIKGQTYYLLGWTENDCLIVTKIRPGENYERAVETREHVHAHHFREKR